MKQRYKNKLKKTMYICILLVFTLVSILPAFSSIANNNTNSDIPMDEKTIQEMFGEDARYDPITGEITYPEDKEKTDTP